MTLNDFYAKVKVIHFGTNRFHRSANKHEDGYNRS